MSDIALSLLTALDEAVRQQQQDQIQIHVLRRALASLPVEDVEDAVDVRLSHPPRKGSR